MTTRSNILAPGGARSGELRSEEAYRRVLGLITDGGLLDGDRLPSETELATRFSVSRPLIRQALSRLQAAGVIDVRWGAGSYIRDRSSVPRDDGRLGTIGSLEEVRHSFALRQAVEGEAAAAAARHRPAEHIEAARRAMAAMDDTLRSNALGQQADLEFHFAIATASQNPLFERVLHSMQRSLEFTISLTRSMALTHPRNRRQTVQAEHVAVFDAVVRGDQEGARQAMRTHLGNSCTRLFLGPGALEPTDP